MEADISSKLQEAKEWLQKEFAGIRSGQASPMLLDGVRVPSYGALVPLNQVGSVNVEDARTLRISVWDTDGIAGVEQAIRDADFGVSVMSDSGGLRIIFPELTAERRTQLLKLAKSKLEDSRITVRSIRDDAMKHIDKELKDGNISEDDRFAQKEGVQEDVDKINRELDVIYSQKEAELEK